jgi:hypothetical protein
MGVVKTTPEVEEAGAAAALIFAESEWEYNDEIDEDCFSVAICLQEFISVNAMSNSFCLVRKLFNWLTVSCKRKKSDS